MSPKELLYIADGLGHEKHMKTCCQNTAQQIQDPQLKAFVESLAERHCESFDKLFSLLG